MLYRRLIRPILFHMDAEEIHEWTLRRLAAHTKALSWVEPLTTFSSQRLAQEVWGLSFRNPVGLAAGFDKFGRALTAWSRLGFGFAEIGTITGQAQPGSEKPRLFRLPDDDALINRFGFNNDGAAETARRLATQTSIIPVGINIGKTKAVSLEQAAEDYALSLEQLWPFGDYFVVNVSSPNTPGLRQLQDKAFLQEIMARLQTINRRFADQRGRTVKPLLIKIAPDLGWPEVDEILEVAQHCGVSGLVATNTTIGRAGLRSSPALMQESGGLSGRPLRHRSTEIIRYIYERLGRELTVVGVGGIFGADDVYEKIKAGASLVQVYTGFVYGGPFFCRKINKDLDRLLRRDGFKQIADAIGRDP